MKSHRCESAACRPTKPPPSLLQPAGRAAHAGPVSQLRPARAGALGAELPLGVQDGRLRFVCSSARRAAALPRASGCIAIVPCSQAFPAHPPNAGPADPTPAGCCAFVLGVRRALPITRHLFPGWPHSSWAQLCPFHHSPLWGFQEAVDSHTGALARLCGSPTIPVFPVVR